MTSITDIAYGGGDDLIDFPISGSHRRMGRPPLKVKPTVVRLPVADIARIRALVGETGLAKFVREAVETALDAKEKAAKKAAKDKKPKG